MHFDALSPSFHKNTLSAFIENASIWKRYWRWLKTKRHTYHISDIIKKKTMTENIAGACACSMRKEFNLSLSKKGNKNVQLFFQHCCKTSGKAMLRVLPPTFKPVNNLICCKAGLMWVCKTHNISIQLVCSNVARQVECFLLPVFPHLYVTACNSIIFKRFSVNSRKRIKTVVWTRIDWWVFDGNENALVWTGP